MHVEIGVHSFSIGCEKSTKEAAAKKMLLQ
jgi:hypothetical protein